MKAPRRKRGKGGPTNYPRPWNPYELSTNVSSTLLDYGTTPSCCSNPI